MAHLDFPALERFTAVLAMCALAGCGQKSYAPVLDEYPEPVQRMVEADRSGLDAVPGVTPVPRAEYAIVAHVMSVKHYHGEALDNVVSYDFALAWGPAATAAVQPSLEVSQRNRWFFWRPRSNWPAGLPKLNEVAYSMANTHMLGATPDLREAIGHVRPGDTIKASGYLVDLASPDPQLRRSTSLTRTDTGAGSCEIFYVRELEVVRR